MGDVGKETIMIEDERGGLYARNIAIAEVATQNIISKFQPTPSSEDRRKAVIFYVQTLIKSLLGCEVFPYGSVPLKTYLPDGDIDLTAFVGPSLEEALANDVVSVLQAEEHNSAAEFVVKDVQLIRAEVKIVKCIMQNIVVDISFNQLGGLCTLCFLEQVNHMIGKDHLFKRSIILVKAWCYYESRILGAPHALISTYALETLVLYIFHLFHSNLDGPLAVLFKFLDYFSKFDWDNYCIGLNGPVRLSSLPEIVEQKLENGHGNLLLSDEFLKDCINMFSVPSRGVDKNSRTFPPKHLNIIDPLKGNNNLGRSVSKGNLFRIRSAFAYGARKLGQALSQEEDSIAEDLFKFFFNTLDRHGNGQRPDVQDLSGVSFPRALSFAETESYMGISETNSVSTNGVRKCVNDDDESSMTRQRGERYNEGGVTENKDEIGCSTEVANNSNMLTPKDGGFASGSPADIEYRLSGDAEDLASSKLHCRKIANGTPENMAVIPHFAPHLYFSGSKANGNSVGKKESISSVRSSNQQVLACAGTKDVSGNENSFCDLNGDYESHLNSLKYGRFCYEHSSGVPAPPLPPPFPSQSDVIWHALPYKRNGFSNVHTDNVGMVPRPGFYPNNPVVLVHPPAPASFGVEDFPKQRGTGTYIPNVNHPPYRNHMMGRGEMNEQGAVSRSHHSPRSTSRTPFKKMNDAFVVNTLDVGHLHGHEDRLEVKSAPHHHILESNSIGGQQNASSTQNLPPPSPPPLCPPQKLQSSNPALPVSSKDTRRLLMENSVYRLKNEDDFPPLSM